MRAPQGPVTAWASLHHPLNRPGRARPLQEPDRGQWTSPPIALARPHSETPSQGGHKTWLSGGCQSARQRSLPPSSPHPTLGPTPAGRGGPWGSLFPKTTGLCRCGASIAGSATGDVCSRQRRQAAWARGHPVTRIILLSPPLPLSPPWRPAGCQQSRFREPGQIRTGTKPGSYRAPKGPRGQDAWEPPPPSPLQWTWAPGGDREIRQRETGLGAEYHTQPWGPKARPPFPGCNGGHQSAGRTLGALPSNSAAPGRPFWNERQNPQGELKRAGNLGGGTGTPQLSQGRSGRPSPSARWAPWSRGFCVVLSTGSQGAAPPLTPTDVPKPPPPPPATPRAGHS